MCGIAGICGQLNIKVKDILKKISHRGPDGYGEWKNDHFELGHLRLSIIDLSDKGHQPMVCHDNWIIYNGEIYNYKKLKEELIEAGYIFRSSSDTEVILYAFIHWGYNFVKKMNSEIAS